MFGLVIIFVYFGLRAPNSPIALTMIGLPATTLSSVLFTIVDMVNPYDGVYDISSNDTPDILGARLSHDPPKH